MKVNIPEKDMLVLVRAMAKFQGVCKYLNGYEKLMTGLHRYTFYVYSRNNEEN